MRRFLFLPVTVVAGLFAGCSNSGNEPVSGTVTYNGSPLPAASVTFLPVGTAGVEGFGTTQSDGKFTIATRQGVEGLPPDDYKVVVSKKTFPDPEQGAYDPESIKEEAPGKHNRVETTPLLAKVTVGGEPFSFSLEGKKGTKK